MINYRFDFDHCGKTIEVVKVQDFIDEWGKPCITRSLVATYSYTAEETVSGLRLISGEVPEEVYQTLYAAFHAWHDINRGFLWKSNFERRI